MTQRPTPLARKLGAGADAPAPSSVSDVKRTKLRERVGGRRGDFVELPLLGRVYMELPGSLAWADIEAEVAKASARSALPPGIEAIAWREGELARRVLAIAMRDPDDPTHATPFATLDEIGELMDNDLVNLAWQAFGDVRERLDPVAELPGPDEMLAITVAVKKKDPILLRTFGVVKLSHWLATTADLQSTSPTPSSPNGGSPSESSD